MNQRDVTHALLDVTWLVGTLFFAPVVRGQAALGEPTGKTRTYYVAADEVNWDYAPSGRDEAMGHPFNGYIFGNMPLMTMRQGDRVRWDVATLGDFNNAHTPH
jgi:hypothetical protein